MSRSPRSDFRIVSRRNSEQCEIFLSPRVLKYQGPSEREKQQYIAKYQWTGHCRKYIAIYITGGGPACGVECESEVRLDEGVRSE